MPIVCKNNYKMLCIVQIHIVSRKRGSSSFLIAPRILLLLLLPDHFRGMAEDHGAPEAGKLPKAWTRGCKERERVAKEQAAQGVRS